MSQIPNLFIIGTQKGGSTSLYHHLSKHPDIGTFREKECNLFMEGVDIPKKLEALGPSTGGDRYLLDGSINYCRYPRHKGVPERILEHVGRDTPRFIYTIRNPVDRLISQYYWNSERYGEHRDLLTAAAEDETYVATGQYDMQMARYLEHFSMDQFLFVQFETFRAAPQAEVNRVLDWLGLSPVTINTDVQLASTSTKTTRSLRLPGLHALVSGTPALRRAVQGMLSDRTIRRLNKLLSREVAREPVDKATRHELLNRHFLESINKTEEMLGLDLSSWKQL
ncbi:sulfotransferase [uncultured Roseobacter sp.]|uniref:sulfotransferase family protein n=1 Tax=uncultured Roseobacter sp. TaxID=114847 RepID=UPI00262C1525|nr:sulfotransferase [uncultured Roseobacter sp.]